MRRVLMYCNQFHPIVGGAERQAQRQAAALRGLGIEVTILTPRLDPSWPEREEIDGVPVERFALTQLTEVMPVRIRGIGVPNALLQGHQIGGAVGRRIPDFDLLHMHLASAGGSFAMRAAHRAGRPAICKVANGGEGFDLHKIEGTSVLGPRFRARLVGELDHWIAISQQICNDLTSAGVPPSRATLIPNGIDPSKLPVAQPRDRVERFLYLGRLNKCNAEMLIAAFALHLAEHSRSRLRIAGHGDVEAVRLLARRHPEAASRVEVPGFSSPLSEYEWADAIVHPTDNEGVSNTLLEAMSIGIPCIASDIPPNRELLQEGEAGLLFQPSDSAALAACMGRLASEANLSPTLREAAKKRIQERYQISRVADRCVELYDRVVSEFTEQRGAR